MFSRSTGLLICLFVAVTSASDYWEEVSISGSDPGVTDNPLRSDNSDWSVNESDHKFEETAGSTRLVLEAECEESVELSVETAVATAVRAIKVSCHNTKQAAVEFIKDHLAQVLSSQGWAHAVWNQPEEVVLLSRLLSERLAATRTTAIGQPTQSDNGNSEHSEALTATAPPTCPTSPLDDDEVSFYRSLSEEEKNKRLIVAAEHGDVEEVRSLLAAGASPRGKDMQGRTALQWAARYGYVEAASCLLEAGADVNAVDDKEYGPLHRAAIAGHLAMVRLLASAGADPDLQDKWGCTPLHLAVREHRLEVVLALLEMGADREVRNKRGFTPLDVARKSNNQRLIDILTQS